MTDLINNSINRSTWVSITTVQFIIFSDYIEVTEACGVRFHLSPPNLKSIEYGFNYRSISHQISNIWMSHENPKNSIKVERNDHCEQGRPTDLLLFTLKYLFFTGENIFINHRRLHANRSVFVPMLWLRDTWPVPGPACCVEPVEHFTSRAPHTSEDTEGKRKVLTTRRHYSKIRQALA